MKPDFNPLSQDDADKLRQVIASAKEAGVGEVLALEAATCMMIVNSTIRALDFDILLSMSEAAFVYQLTTLIDKFDRQTLRLTDDYMPAFAKRLPMLNRYPTPWTITGDGNIFDKKGEIVALWDGCNSDEIVGIINSVGNAAKTMNLAALAIESIAESKNADMDKTRVIIRVKDHGKVEFTMSEIVNSLRALSDAISPGVE